MNRIADLLSERGEWEAEIEEAREGKIELLWQESFLRSRIRVTWIKGSEGEREDAEEAEAREEEEEIEDPS